MSRGGYLCIIRVLAAINCLHTNNAESFETEFTVIGDNLALGNNCFYFWDITSGKITAFNIKTQKFKTLDIDTVNGVELEDGWYISVDSDRVMKVTSDERFVFADRNAGAIRVLYKK